MENKLENKFGCLWHLLLHSPKKPYEPKSFKEEIESKVNDGKAIFCLECDGYGNNKDGKQICDRKYLPKKDYFP